MSRRFQTDFLSGLAFDLNEMGKDGWEAILIKSNGTTAAAHDDFTWVVFKRENLDKTATIL